MRAWLTAAAVAIVAFAVRIGGALHYAFWQDEVASARVIAKSSPIGVVHQVARTEATPPLWYWLGWVVHELGVPMTDVRVVSALAGALTAAGVVLYAERLVPLWAALLAGLATALGWQFVFHGRELRAYALHALLSVLLAFAAARRRPVLLGVVVAAGALTNYFFVLSVGAVLVWIWTSAHARSSRRRLSAAVAIGLVPFAAWIPELVFQYRHHRASFIGSFDGREVRDAFWLLFARALPQTSVLHTLAPILLLAAIVAGSLVLSLSDVGRLCALLALGPFCAAALIWLAGPRIFDIRNLIGAGPFAAIAVCALLALVPRPAGIAAGAALAGLLVFGFVLGNRTKPIAYDRIASSLVGAGWTQADPIVVRGDFFAFRSPLEWYLPGRPALTLGVPRGRCARVFVVGHGKVVRHDDRRPHGHLLVSTERHAACVRALPESKIRAGLAGSA
ncbi:MAG TPA: glycosyltransferase family 39 protein [Gaiellaceae bacterium]|nr:glycosyltransferase family 39 protein [Gaiellaceae bacterium]